MTTTLPTRRSNLIGRDAELAALTERLKEASLLTLVGVGGVGKTSLAQELARDRRDLGGEVHLVDLTAVTSDGAVGRQAADQVGLPASGDLTAVEALATRFGQDEVLLVVDNCEHVLDGVAETVDELLARCPGLTVLATSRERIDLPGEVVWPVGPLDTESADGTAPAVALMLDRAGGTTGRLSAADRAALTDLARQLDGVPLALELASARLATMSIEELTGRLQDHLPELRGGRRSAARHRSLGDVVDWSYELLEASTRRTFDRLAVFVGGFTRQAAVDVLGEDVDDALDRLVGASLLVAQEGSPTRYRMLQMIRAFARERLQDHDDLADLERRHALWVTEWVGRSTEGMRSADEAATVEAFDAETANIGAALRWACENHEPGVITDVVRALEDHILHRAGREMQAWVAEALDAMGDDPGDEVVTLIGSLAAIRRGDLAGARALWSRAVASGWEGRGLAMPATGIDAVLSTFEGRLDHGIEAGAAWREQAATESPWLHGFASAETSLASAYRGDHDHALALSEAATEIALPTGAPSLLAWCAYGRAEARIGVDPPAALRDYGEAQRYAEKAHNQFLLALASVSRASALARYGEPGDAFEHFGRAVELFDHTAAWSYQSTTLRNLTELLARVERYEDATVLRAAVDTLAGTTGVAGRDAARAAYLKALLEDRLLSRRYAELVEEGSHLSRADVLERARRVIDEERAARRPGPEFAAVVFTDLVGATAFMAEAGDREARDVMRRYEILAEQLLTGNRGRRVKGTGDGMLAVFPTVSEALACVRTLLRTLDEGRASGEWPLQVRVGVHAGEMIDETGVEDGGDIHGTVVNLTARVVDRADGGEVVVTDTVRQIVAGAGFAFEGIGTFDLKGIPEPTRLYRLVTDPPR